MNASIGTVIAADHQNRRVMSSSSGLLSSIVTTRGSSAMPQIGQEPGASRTISGCIGHVHSVFVTGATVTGSSAIPHFGQAPGPFCRTSIHGAVLPLHVGRRNGTSRTFSEKRVRRRTELVEAALAAEVVGLTLDDMPDGIVGRDGHPTDRVEDFGRCDGGMAVIVA